MRVPQHRQSPLLRSGLFSLRVRRIVSYRIEYPLQMTGINQSRRTSRAFAAALT
jgi:hypothetical protein